MRLLIDCVVEGEGNDGKYHVCTVPQDRNTEAKVWHNARPGVRVEVDFAVKEVFCWVPTGGYWMLRTEVLGARVAGTILRLPRGPLGWWHGVQGVHDAGQQASAGTGIRIGVIDEAMATDVPPDIEHVKNIGASAWGMDDGGRAYDPETDHALSVCSLLASRAASPDGFLGMAPGAEVTFAAAGSDGNRGDEARACLSPSRLANSLEVLVAKHQCDIISFSAGDCEDPVPEVELAARAAREAGSICFTAAGNEGNAPLYPARYEELLAVGAAGHKGVAPPQTPECLAEVESARNCEGDLFYWHGSARGPGVNYVAPGVAVFSLFDSQQLGGSGLRSVIGTSFAAPMAAGIAARILGSDEIYKSLPRTRRRAEYALSVLNECANGSFKTLCEHGLIVI